RQLNPFHFIEAQTAAHDIKHVIAARVMIPSDGIHQGGIADALSTKFRYVFDWETRHQLVVHAVGGRSETNNWFSPPHQQIRRDVVSRDEIDATVDKRFFRRRRTVAKLESHF